MWYTSDYTAAMRCDDKQRRRRRTYSGPQFILDRLQAKAVITEIVKLVAMASDMHATD